jgi:hypothetical protein
VNVAASVNASFKGTPVSVFVEKLKYRIVDSANSWV